MQNISFFFLFFRGNDLNIIRVRLLLSIVRKMLSNVGYFAEPATTKCKPVTASFATLINWSNAQILINCHQNLNQFNVDESWWERVGGQTHVSGLQLSSTVILVWPCLRCPIVDRFICFWKMKNRTMLPNHVLCVPTLSYSSNLLFARWYAWAKIDMFSNLASS